ncbi:MarR family winged helix-turn-helix transcriptional regulator [Sphingomonas echinoides]|uniref:MarR family transcriptional regulator n=1 Tax=Sphingomonas echinoides TaxID=59803 RepID=A0ABU4PI43_9SPHN|nr:MarR family transcriptional regulator [Sphingomonas echinoides]MDX5983861.1 MarR family transcriptional regulator [Sphingomonas echinoides]
MYNTGSIDTVARALVDLLGFFSSPQRVDLLLKEADVVLDRALVPLLVAIATRGTLSVAALADQVGRDSTTVSRQLAKLAQLGLVAKGAGESDRRIRMVTLSPTGEGLARSVAAARRRLLARAVAAWSEDDLADLGRLNAKFVESLAHAAQAGSEAELG